MTARNFDYKWVVSGRKLPKGVLPLNRIRRLAGGRKANTELITDWLETDAGSLQRFGIEARMTDKELAAAPQLRKWYDALFNEFGLDPQGCARAEAKFIELGMVPDEVALALGREIMEKFPDVDTVYYSCPHWAMVGAIDVLEKEFGVTVVQPIQAIIWQALRRSGVDDSIDGFGRLLRDF